MHTLIGLTGARRVGKDFVADCICKHVGISSTVDRFAFADPLREVTRTLFGLTDKHFIGDKTEPTDVTWDTLCPLMRYGSWTKRGRLTTRELLQVFGTQLMREMWSDSVWVDVAMRRIRAAEQFDYVVVSDVRFPNEARMIREQGGKIWKVVGPVRGVVSSDPDISTHASERQNIHADIVIENGTEAHVYRQLDTYLPVRGGLFESA